MENMGTVWGHYGEWGQCGVMETLWGHNGEWGYENIMGSYGNSIVYG